MEYQYKVLHESDFKILEVNLNRFGEDGWKLVNIVYDYDNSLLIATLVKENKGQ